MESGKIFGSDEDSRRSCESGWTMYLASPSHDHDGYNCYYDHDDDDEEDSDGGESMESDASSGPMEANSCLKLHKEVEDQKSASKKKKKKSDEEMVSVETTTRVLHNINHDDDDDDDNDDDGDNHVYDYGNDNYSAVHSYVGSVRHERVSLI